MRLLLLFFLLLPLFASPLPSKSLQKVSLQLVWLDQFQFAGYYMAKEKGFYKDAGFEVELKKFQYDMDTFLEVSEGRATYGVGRPSIILYDSLAKKIAIMAAIFQSSPNILIALESSDINTIKDFDGKVIMQTRDLVQSASISAMLQSKGITGSNIKIMDHNFQLSELIDKKVDLYSGYLSNEPYTLSKLGIKYKIFSPKEEGFDFYSDLLFTSQKNIQDNYVSVGKFKEASILGWEYAFSHIEESVDLILKKYNSQNKTREALIFEAKELKKLAYYKTDKIGVISEDKIQRTYDIYKILGLTKTPLNLAKIIYNVSKVDFTKKEREYLVSHPQISFCAQPNNMPYSAIKDGKIIGISSGILDLITKESGIEFKLIKTDSWEESLEKAAARECDIVPLVVANKKRQEYFNFSTPFYTEPLVIVTRNSENYILDINSIADKDFAVVKGNFFLKDLEAKYPTIKLHEVDSLKEALESVEQGKYYGSINTLMGAAYGIQYFSKINLKIVGKFENNVELSFAVRNDDATLISIFDKVTKSLKKEDTQKIFNRWVSINYVNKVDVWYFKEIIFIIAVFLLFLLYREYFLKKKNKELKFLQEELINLNHTLESRISEATSDLDKAQEVSKIGSWILDLTKKELRWSKQTYQIFDYSKEENSNLYQMFLDRIHPKDVDKVQSEYTKSLEEKTPYQLEHRLLMDDGDIKYIKENCETLFSPDGIPLISYGTVQDITDKVKLEQEIKKKDGFMLHQSRLAQMGEMMSMIAHQWKQPLSAIAASQISVKVALELGKYDFDKPQEREEFFKFLDKNLEKIALYVQTLSGTIQDFSDFYKPTKKSIWTSVDSIVSKSYKLLNDSLSAAGITVKFELQSKSQLKMHENEFMQVILNMVVNAKEQLISKKINNPEITIRTYEEDKHIFLEIEDNAGGIDEEIMEYVFDPYFSTKHEKNGTGLGLHMSRIIINEYHNGNINVKNGEHGAIFTISLLERGGVITK